MIKIVCTVCGFEGLEFHFNGRFWLEKAHHDVVFVVSVMVGGAGAIPCMPCIFVVGALSMA
jgi:hypothetical protein